MPLKVVRNDITKMNTEAIVNTASSEPYVGTGCDCAVYNAAGYEKLFAEREKVGTVAEGDVFITDGYELPARYIIHAVSPLYIDGESGEEQKLRFCYEKSLRLALDKNIKSIAFPLISTGSFGYPKIEGLRIAMDEINAFLMENDLDVSLVVFDDKSTGMAERLFPELKTYIDKHYVTEQTEAEYGGLKAARPMMSEPCLMSEARPMAAMRPLEAPRQEPMAGGKATNNSKSDRRSIFKQALSVSPFGGKSTKGSSEKFQDGRLEDLKVDMCVSAKYSLSESEDDYDIMDDFEDEIDESELEERIRHIKDPFGVYFFYLADRKGMTSQDVQNGAWITKQVYHKIKKSPETYHPDKRTALRLSVALKLNLDETKDFLARAGYAFSCAMMEDIIWQFGIEKKLDIYDMSDLMEDNGFPKLVDF